MAGSLRRRRRTAPKPISERELAIILGNLPKVAQAKLAAFGLRRSLGVITMTRHRHKYLSAAGRRASQRWQESELAWLRKNYETVTRNELRDAFPHRGLQGVEAKARSLGLRKERRLRGRVPLREHIDLVRAIIARAQEDGISLSALDRETGMTNHYWLYTWRRVNVNLDAVVKAVVFFGGRIKITIDWQDE